MGESLKYLSPSEKIGVVVKTGPSGMGAMLLSTKMDAKGIGKQSRSIQTLTQEARREENSFLHAFFQKMQSTHDTEDMLTYAGWNYCDLPELIGPYISSQSIATHHMHFGVIKREEMKKLPIIGNVTQEDNLKQQIMCDFGVADVFSQNSYDCSMIGLSCLKYIGNADIGKIPETNTPSGALRFHIEDGLSAFKTDNFINDITLLVEHVSDIHRHVTQSWYQCKNSALLQNKDFLQKLQDAIQEGKKQVFFSEIDGVKSEVRIPCKNFPTHVAGYYMIDWELFFYISPVFFCSGYFEKLGMSLCRVENQDGYMKLRAQNTTLVDSIMDNLADWKRRYEGFQGEYRH